MADSLLNKKLTLARTVLKRFEPNIGLYCFYNAQNKCCINMDYTSGEIVCALDGSITIGEVLEVLIENNPEIEGAQLKESLLPIFNNLLEKEFLVAVDG